MLPPDIELAGGLGVCVDDARSRADTLQPDGLPHQQ